MATQQEIFLQTSQILQNIEAQFEFSAQDLQDEEWNVELHAKFLHDMKAIANMMKTEVTKLALVVDINAEKQPSIDDLKGVTKGVEQASITLWSTYLVLSSRSGLTFAKKWSNTCQTIISTARNLIINLSQGLPRQRALTTVGEVWQKCDELIQSSSCQDNVQAVIEGIKGERRLIKDAIEELEQAKQNPDEDEQWEDKELSVLSPALGLLKTAQATLMKIMTALKSKGDPWKSVQDMDRILGQCQKLSPAVDELALTLYPPMEFNDIQAKSKDLIELILNTIEALKTVHFVSNQDFEEWGTFLLKGVDHNRGKLELALTDAKMDGLSVK